MLKRLSVILVIAALLLTTGSSMAQDRPTITIGEEVAGEITNSNFFQEYLFEGQAGDVIVITLTRSPNADFDPLLYLTTVDNQPIAQNDDFSDLNSRIVVRRSETQTYQVVATRLGERTGTGEGAFTLLIEQSRTFAPGEVVEGTLDASKPAPPHIFAPEAAGIYTVNYKLIRGDYFPALIIYRLQDGSTYTEEIGRLSAMTLHGGSLTIEIEMDSIYIIGFESGYNYDTVGSAVYTITIDEVLPESE